ncbi:MAG: DNA polymerase III subunit alpha [Treponema sp.]|nr:DNA polymerase III subunit alpha [Treponema sp.]
MADIHVFPEAPEGTPKANFVHLHVHSDYSLLDSCCKLDALIAKAKRLNMPALALTDHGNMFGVLNFEHICHANGINPIVGCEFYVGDDHTKQEKTKYGKHNYHLILLCENETGYKNMSWLCSDANTEGQYFGKPRIDFEMLKQRHEGLICLTACIAGELPQTLLNDTEEAAEELITKYRDLFGPDHYYIELQDHGLPEQKELNPKLIKLARKLNVPLVVTNDIHYMEKEDAEAQDALRCIGFKQLLNDKDRQTMGDGRTEWYFKTEEEMRQLFPDVPDAYENTIKIANMCNLTIHQYKTQELKDCLPRFELPKEFQTHGDDYTKNQDDYVRYLVEQGLRKRYPEITPEIRMRSEYELGIIFKMGFSGYFLIVWEFINWSKSTYDNVNKKPKEYMPIGPGRGSGAGSLVAYCLGITDIDPFRFKLIFERFLNPERVSMPDFDVDMDFDFRQDIIKHTRDLYGEPQVGHIVTFGTLKPKQCIADVGRVLDIPLSEVNMLKSLVPDNPKAKLKDAFETSAKFPEGEGGLLAPYKDDPRYKRLFSLAMKLEGCNRNTGLHASGMVVGLTALPNWAPVFKDPKTGEVGVQYTMDIIEPCGLVKFDYLGLKTLSLIRYAENIINKHKKPEDPVFNCATVSESDPKTFELFCRGDSVAVFQFESPGMQKILRQFKPEKLEDLVALNALYRPGPLEYIPNYIDGKWKPETVHYPDPCLEDILKETYGVMVYQEQVMQVSQRIAGFSLGGADMLRRAMGKKKPEVMAAKQIEFEEGAVKQGFTKEHAAEIFNIMIPFAGYGFNKSHAAAYSVLAYRTGYLKANYPAEFMAANLTNEITSTDTLPEYIAEARKIGIEVDPPDVNRSDIIFDVVNGRIVFGLKGIKGMGEGAARAIVNEREENGPYKSFMDFVKRAGTRIERDEAGHERVAVNKKAIEVLIKTGAFDHVGEEGEIYNRPTLLENLEPALEYAMDILSDKMKGQGDLFGDLTDEEKNFTDYTFKIIPDLPYMELLNMEKECIGCYVSGHPLDSYKKAIERAVTLKSSNISRIAAEEKAAKDAMIASGAKFWQLKNSGKNYVALGTISGLHEITTKKGTRMAFAKLTDYDGIIDCTFFSDEWEKLKPQIEDGKIYAFSGKVDGSREGQSPSLLVSAIENPDEMENRSINSVHIMLDSSFNSEASLNELKDFLLGKTGTCSVYFHMSIGNNAYVIKANDQLHMSVSDDNLKNLKEISFVKQVWTE